MFGVFSWTKCVFIKRTKKYSLNESTCQQSTLLIELPLYRHFLVILFFLFLSGVSSTMPLLFQYAKYMEPNHADGVRDVFRRACTIHLPQKPNLHLEWAAFEERQSKALMTILMKTLTSCV